MGVARSAFRFAFHAAAQANISIYCSVVVDGLAEYAEWTFSYNRRHFNIIFGRGWTIHGLPLPAVDICMVAWFPLRTMVRRSYATIGGSSSVSCGIRHPLVACNIEYRSVDLSPAMAKKF